LLRISNLFKYDLPNTAEQIILKSPLEVNVS